MAARPRKYGEDIPNLYVDKRDSGTYYKYRDPRTGKKHSLGKDKVVAEQRARTLNAIIGQQIADQHAENIAASVSGMRFADWIPHYLELQKERLALGEIVASTLADRQQKCRNLVKAFNDLPLTMVSTRRIAAHLDTYRKAGKARMAVAVRSLLVDIFSEAMAKGFYPADKPNPAYVTKAPRVTVKRSRLTLERWQQIGKELQQYPHAWAYNAALLALVTAQRLGDVRKMRFSDVKRINGRDYLEVVQDKTGNRVRLDLDLRLESIGLSIRDVISMCRDNVVSPYMIHHRKRIAQASPSKMVRLKSIAAAFAESRDACAIEWEGTPASFHELRSLSEREYKKQGVDTKALLGHKTQRMSDTYDDARGSDWVVVGVK